MSEENITLDPKTSAFYFGAGDGAQIEQELAALEPKPEFDILLQMYWLNVGIKLTGRYEPEQAEEIDSYVVGASSRKPIPHHALRLHIVGDVISDDASHEVSREILRAKLLEVAEQVADGADEGAIRADGKDVGQFSVGLW